MEDSDIGFKLLEVACCIFVIVLILLMICLSVYGLCFWYKELLLLF